MAIVRRAPGLFGLQGHMRGIQRASRAVAWVDSSSNRLVSSAFVIAPRLVVTAGYVIAQMQRASESIRLMELGGETGTPAELALDGAPELLGEPLESLLGHQPIGLLALGRDYPWEPLRFADTLPVLADLVQIVQFLPMLVQTISTGQVLDLSSTYNEPFIAYDADTEPGGGGAPVFDRDWRVVAMHMLGDASEKRNSGLARSAIIEALTRSVHWPEIARHQEWADLAKMRRPAEPATPGPADEPLAAWQARAALVPTFDPAGLGEQTKAWLGERVDVVFDVDEAGQDVEHWSMRLEERQAVCARAGSLGDLRALYDTDTLGDPSRADGVVRAILSGPPYDLGKTSADETPEEAAAAEEALGWWLQAIHWLSSVAPDLPTASVIARALARRQSRASLARVAKADFRGRVEWLAELERWYASDEGPLAIYGHGGIGKSALMGRFALGLKGDPLILWLDFDRPDLAPDDAFSILDAVRRAASVQLDLAVPDPQPPSSSGSTSLPDAWHAPADALGKALNFALQARTDAQPPLVVLDSFEAAQYSDRYQELWPVIERLAEHIPRLRVLVSGRAPVSRLWLAGKPARVERLDRLNDDEARRYLYDLGIKDSALVERIVGVVRGVPLNLQLAARLVGLGGGLADLPVGEIEAVIATGLLQRRILDRLKKPAYQSLAKGALVLRRLSAEMIVPVLGSHVDLPPGDADAWMVELRREMGLLEPGAELRVRPEVRGATLHILEGEQHDFVAAIDRSAERWYANLPSPTRTERAELVYHRLRLGDIEGAATAWRPDCADLLTETAPGELSPDAEHWLAGQGVKQNSLLQGDRASVPDSLPQWEADALVRILDARTRALERIVPQIAAERHDRTSNSAIVFHEACALRDIGHPDQARKLLEEAGEGAGAVARDRRVIAALLARDGGDRAEAERLLSRLAEAAQWTDRADRGDASLCALAAAAARMWLCVDFDAEIELARIAADRGKTLVGASLLSASDAILPALRMQLQDYGGAAALEAVTDRTLDAAPDVWRESRGRLREHWEESHENWTSEFRQDEQHWLQSDHWSFAFDADRADDRETRVAVGLTELAWRRAFLLIDDLFPLGAIEASLADDPSSRLHAALLGTLALFARRFGDLAIVVRGNTLADVVRAALQKRGNVALSAPAWEIARQRLTDGVDSAHDWGGYARSQSDGAVIILVRDLVDYRGSHAVDPEGMVGALLFSLVAPDPLTALAEMLAGVPARVAPTSEAQAMGAIQDAAVAADATAPDRADGAVADDPNKGVFGGASANKTAVIDATVTPFEGRNDLFTVDLQIRALSKQACDALVGKPATIVLHPTFRRTEHSRVFDSSGTVRLRIVAFGAFTVGVRLPELLGTLELDLARIEAPQSFLDH